MHWIYLIHKFHNLSWITEINELFHDILIYWDAPVYAYFFLRLTHFSKPLLDASVSRHSYNNNNNLLHLYSAFLDTQSALHIRGVSPHPPPVFSIHLDDDATAAILRQNAHHTPSYWWRGDRVMKPISVWGWLGGHDAGVTPLLFFEWHPGIFNDHRESGPRFNVSSEGRCFLQYSVPVTTLGHEDPHRPQGEHPLLASVTPLPAAT